VSCEEDGLWQEAWQAWIETRARPGADFVGCSVRAAEAAVQAGDRVAAVALLDSARDDEPDHPRVLFHDAISEKDPQKALSKLDAIQTADGALAASVQVAKVSAAVELRDFAAARRALSAAADAGARETLPYRMTETSLAVHEMMDAARPRSGDVVRLADDALDLEAELLRRNQYEQAAGVRAQASAFYGFAGDRGKAEELLASAVETYNVDAADPRLTIAMAASYLGNYDIVEALIRPDDDRARARYLRAAIKSRGSEDEQREAVGELDGLLDHENEDIRSIAAVRRLALAGAAAGIEWSDEAEAVVAKRQLAPVVVFKASWLESNDRRDGAERELLVHSDEAWALTELMYVSARAKDWSKAARYADALLAHGEADWEAQRSAADALHLGGDKARAQMEFERLAADPDAPVSVRAVAYRRLAEPSLNNGDYGRAVRITGKWLDLEPDEPDAAWVHVLALAGLGRDAEAIAAINQRDLHPRQPAEYRVASQLYINADDAVSALRKVIAFADEHSPPSEELEMFVVIAALRAGADVPKEFRERVSFERFTELFPESERLQTRSLDEFQQFLDEDLPERARHIQTIDGQIMKDGNTPTAILALVTDNDMGALWMRLSWSGRLPMGYCVPELDELERSDARAALGGSAVWDGTSVFVVDHVLTDLAHVIRTAFPGSIIPQSALADIAEGVRALTLESGERAEVSYNLAAGQPELREWDRERTEAFAGRARSALDFAHQLKTCPDSDPADPQPEDRDFDGDISSAFRAVLAVASASRRLNLPIYSDDRDIRRRARADGLRAFGTIALLDVLAEAGYISSEQRTAARLALLNGRALGVNPGSDELIELGRSADWKPSVALDLALADAWPWLQDADKTFQAWVLFLRQVRREAPAELRYWIVRLFDAIRQAVPELRVAFLAQHLVMLALIPTEPDATQYCRAVIAALALARPYLHGDPGDPAMAGFVAFATVISQHHQKAAAGAVIGRSWAMLPFDDQLRTLPLISS